MSNNTQRDQEDTTNKTPTHKRHYYLRSPLFGIHLIFMVISISLVHQWRMPDMQVIYVVGYGVVFIGSALMYRAGERQGAYITTAIIIGISILIPFLLLMTCFMAASSSSIH